MRSGSPPFNLRCEYLTNPLGIDETLPRLSWQMQSGRRGDHQTAYQILVASSDDVLRQDKGDLWNSGRIEGPESVHIEYGGAALVSRQACFWKVRTWNGTGEMSGFSPSARWEMGLLNRDDWKASWISFPVEIEPSGGAPCPHLRKEFTIESKVQRARIYATALGVYRLYVNGVLVSADLFRPGWTEYRRRLQYQTYDVTDLLTRGKNVIGAIVGEGWYCGHFGPGAVRENYGRRPSLLVQLETTLEDGTAPAISSDESWRGSLGPLRRSDILLGENFDARIDLGRWSEPDFDESHWGKTTKEDPPNAMLVAQRSYPVRRLKELRPISIKEPATGTYVFDLGQNMVGWGRLSSSGAAGSEIQLRFAEMLNPDGTIYTENLGSAQATDRYVLSGNGPEIWEPSFTFHGFRYVEMTGLQETPTPETLTGIVVGSELPEAGSFRTSSALVNQLQSNIQWSQRGNFLEVPTDCPQRDERLGWMGDAQVFIRTACFNADVVAFFEKWMVDVWDAQSDEGSFSDVAPKFHFDKDGAPGWGDAGVIVPWTLYQWYGDKRILERGFEPMRRWVEFIRKENPNLIWTNRVGNNYGDWLAIGADTPKDLLATAFFAYSTSILSRVAQVLGKKKDAEHYEGLFKDIRSAFNREFVDESGAIKGGTQTAYVLALGFDLLSLEHRTEACRRLVKDIERKKGHLSTGFLGIAHLLPSLTQGGELELAYRLLTKRSFPSWGYSIKQGATTMWERWDGWTKEKGAQDPRMNSFNHYAYGSVGQWLYEVVSGISPDPSSPGFKHILIRPRPSRHLSFAEATYESVYGKIGCSWRRRSGTLSVSIEIPPNASATIHVPAGPGQEVSEGGEPVSSSSDIRFIERTDDSVILEVGAGRYRFKVK